MPPINKPNGSDNSRNNSGGNSRTLGCIILIIIIILIFFFWRFINHRTANWAGNAKEGTPSAIVQSNPSPIAINDMPYIAPVVTEYNSEYLRWAGKVAAGQYATWGKITLESSEVPVGGAVGPRPPAIVYGNIREATGAGIDFMIFNEENYQAWRSGEKDVQFYYIGKSLSDYNYTVDVSQGSYYIVAENTSAADDAFIGFTGVLAYSRTLSAEETPLNQNQHFTYVWDIKTEKLTLWEYILKLFQPTYNVSVTPPAISEKRAEN